MSTDETGPPVLSDGDCARLWRMLSEPSADGRLAALDRAVERMRAAEAKLAAIEAYCRERSLEDDVAARYGGKPVKGERVLADILAIIGSEEGGDDAQPAAPGELCACRCKNPKGKCGCCDESLNDWYAAMDEGSESDA